MERSRQSGTLLISALVLIALIMLMSKVLTRDDYSNLAGAEFLVS